MDNCEVMSDILRKVSFCITCKGRLHHLRQTLRDNIIANADFDSVEFVLLNYSSPDDMSCWVLENLTDEIRSGRVAYYQLDGVSHYIPTHAKNVAHRLAASPIVCNLDADNFTGSGFAAYLYEEFLKDKRIFVRTSGMRGASGRLAFLKEDFCSLGGYDEDLNLGWGFDDTDLRNRAVAFGLRPVVLYHDSPFLGVIQHDDSERTKYTPESAKLVSRNAHAKMSKEQLSPVRNIGHNWGAARLVKNFEEIVEI